MSSISGSSGYVLVPLREGADFTRQHSNPSPVLVVAPPAEQPSPQTLRRLAHEYSLAADDPAWAAKPLALTRHVQCSRSFWRDVYRKSKKEEL